MGDETLILYIYTVLGGKFGKVLSSLAFTDLTLRFVGNIEKVHASYWNWKMATTT